MKLDYIISDTTVSATSASLKEAVKIAESDVFSNVLVIVPEPKSIAIERELLDYSKFGAFANIFVYSFVRLLSRIGGIDEQTLVSKQTCVMILRKIILDNIDKLVCYKKTAKAVGFAEKIYDTIEQFKSSSCTVEDVKNIAKNSSGALKSKMTDIALLFELYENVLAGGLFDDCDRLMQLSNLAKTSDFIKSCDVFIVGFDNMTADMCSCLKEIATHAKSITFSCVYFDEKRKDKYIQDNTLFNKFIAIANKLNYPYIPKLVKSNHKGDFWNIQNYLYSTEKKQVESVGNVRIFELDSKAKEIDCLANLIMQEINNGKRFRDFAVIDADFDKDIDIIDKVFNDYNIPHFITKSYNISTHFFVRFIKDSIEVILSNYSANKVLKWLANPLLELSGLSEFENYVKEFGVNWSGFFVLATNEQVKSEENLDKVNSIINFIKKFSEDFTPLFSNEKTISDFIKNCERLVEFVDAKNKLLEISKFEKLNNLDIDSEITSVIYDKFLKINSSMLRFLGEQKIQPSEFLAIYMTGFAEEEVNLIPISVDTVIIQKKSDGLYKIKDLFIIGATDGGFPIKMADTGILQDDELLQSEIICGNKIEPLIKDINKREKFNQFELMLLATEKLIILYSNRSFGSSNKPANVVNRLKNLFNLEPIKDYNKFKFITQKNAEKQFAKKIGEYLSGEVIGETEINDDYNLLKNVLSPHFNSYLENLSFGNREFIITGASEIFFVNNKTSVSQLEKYFACPYSFFAKYGLRLKENKNANLSNLDIGTIVHKFAEIFTKNISKFDGVDEKEFDIRTRKILEISLDELGINKRKNVAVLNFISSEVVRLAKYLKLEQDKSSFKNDSKLNEFEFFGNNAVKLQIDENTVISIEGKIDRIDKFKDYIRIIDYKTGEIDNSLSSIYFGKKIQLVSYLSASQKINDTKVAGLFYFPIHSNFVKIQKKMKNNYKMQGFLLDNIDVVKYMDSSLSLENNESNFVPIKIKNNEETRETGEFVISYGRTKVFLSQKEFENIKLYTESLCKQAVSEILSGYIEPSPIAKLNDRESDECLYCELNGFCGRENAKFGKARRCGGEIKEINFEKEGNNGN